MQCSFFPDLSHLNKLNLLFFLNLFLNFQLWKLCIHIFKYILQLNKLFTVNEKFNEQPWKINLLLALNVYGVPKFF